MQKSIPKHLAIIMDGNRRWAKKKNLPTLKGHQKGYDKLKQVGDWCLEKGIKFLSVYSFSTENWKRSKHEVSYLIKLLTNALKNDLQEFNQKGIRLKVIGQIERYSKSKLSKDISHEDLATRYFINTS